VDGLTLAPPKGKRLTCRRVHEPVTHKQKAKGILALLNRKPQKGKAMTDDTATSRSKRHFESDFEPAAPSGSGIDIQATLRQAVALEYIAYHMGQIDKKLDRLIEASERLATSDPLAKL
jgi:hypothetical protein